jgi:hypothetical protein
MNQKIKQIESDLSRLQKEHEVKLEIDTTNESSDAIRILFVKGDDILDEISFVAPNKGQMTLNRKMFDLSFTKASMVKFVNTSPNGWKGQVSIYIDNKKYKDFKPQDKTVFNLNPWIYPM